MPSYPSTLAERRDARIASSLLALPPRALARFAGKPIVIEGVPLNLEHAAILRLMKMRGGADVSTMTVDQARARVRASTTSVAGTPLALAMIRDAAVAGADGPLAARLYVPAEAAGPGLHPLLIFFHGGGWVVGSIDTHDALCRHLAQASGARVLSVAYRLAPEHPYPAAADDATAAFLDVATSGERFGADPARIAVGGDSAGANLAAVCTNDAVRAGGPRPAFQLLIYPAVDNVTQDRPSQQLFRSGFFLTVAAMAWYRSTYLGADEPRVAPDPRSSPLFSPDLSAAAPAHIVTAGFDPLRDEGEAYAQRLREEGIPVTLRRHAGFIHGFANMVGVGRSGRDAVIEMGGVLRRALGA
ncbi:unannotated protein [freshwater metagenome]|uniref:Unannotated protein n=1 Tax=freshwater metagenome TaxID=449393 RepID=A0A6J7E2F6_9ZZZZ|nr:alpha/beta hydrolase fold domain-containing protein [Actinomycetota bacterium]